MCDAALITSHKLIKSVSEMQKTTWTIQQTRELYNIAQWSEGYFNINELGHLTAHPNRDKQQPGIDLVELTQSIQQAGLRLPVLVRFSDILKDRLQNLQNAFSQAQKDYQYQAGYTSVYPIKVNQHHQVINELLKHGGDHFGLEAGSKPELMAVLSFASLTPRMVICNGYKDRHYIRLALMGQMLGHQTFLIIEKYSELQSILAEAKALGVTPRLGVRVRLASIGKGKWQNTGGEKSKFGLTCAQVLQLLKDLREQNCLSALQVVHFHLGSQIANIRDIQKGLHECARFYAELRSYGAPIEYIDVGGGLGVDYEGTHSRSFCSINYSMHEYAHNVVRAFTEICAQAKQPHPHIITESGRALTAHHAMLITNLVDVETPLENEQLPSIQASDSFILRDLNKAHADVNERNLLETYHEICYAIGEAQEMYVHGTLNLVQRAQAEQLYLFTCKKIKEHLDKLSLNRTQQEILTEINEKLADKYFVNFSLFQSLPDVWAIDQIFPVLPLAKLNKAPTRRGTLQDLTCDSDGRIDHYVDGYGIENTLPLAPFDKNEPYLLGIFLVGAYQEILGDIHNLFGDTDSVQVECLANGQFQLILPAKGDEIKDVLRFVKFDMEQMQQSYQEQCLQAHLSPEQQKIILAELTESLCAYTYLQI